MASKFIGTVRKTERHHVPALMVLVLATALWVGCSQQRQSDTEAEKFEQRLIEYHQSQLETKLSELEQIEITLAEAKREIDEIEPQVARPLPLKAVHNLTTEELTQYMKRPGLEARLVHLKEQEETLLAAKRALERDITELEQLLGHN